MKQYNRIWVLFCVLIVLCTCNKTPSGGDMGTDTTGSNLPQTTPPPPPPGSKFDKMDLGQLVTYANTNTPTEEVKDKIKGKCATLSIDDIITEKNNSTNDDIKVILVKELENKISAVSDQEELANLCDNNDITGVTALKSKAEETFKKNLEGNNDLTSINDLYKKTTVGDNAKEIIRKTVIKGAQDTDNTTYDDPILILDIIKEDNLAKDGDVKKALVDRFKKDLAKSDDYNTLGKDKLLTMVTKNALDKDVKKAVNDHFDELLNNVTDPLSDDDYKNLLKTWGSDSATNEIKNKVETKLENIFDEYSKSHTFTDTMKNMNHYSKILVADVNESNSRGAHRLIHTLMKKKIKNEKILSKKLQATTAFNNDDTYAKLYSNILDNDKPSDLAKALGNENVTKGVVNDLLVKMVDKLAAKTTIDNLNDVLKNLTNPSDEIVELIREKVVTPILNDQFETIMNICQNDDEDEIKNNKETVINNLNNIAKIYSTIKKNDKELYRGLDSKKFSQLTNLENALVSTTKTNNITGLISFKEKFKIINEEVVHDQDDFRVFLPLISIITNDSFADFTDSDSDANGLLYRLYFYINAISRPKGNEKIKERTLKYIDGNLDDNQVSLEDKSRVMNYLQTGEF